MLEAYAFLAVFTIQILEISVLGPTRFIRYVRVKATRLPVAQLFPGVDRDSILERYLTRFRVLQTVIAVLGLLLLGWLFSYMRRPDWDADTVGDLTFFYFMVQMLPGLLVARFAVRLNKALKRLPPEGVRKATLQRRGLFDFVSPFTVFLAVASYFLFVAVVMYVEQHPFPGFGGALPNIGIITLGYAGMASIVYWYLYGRKSGPLETHTDRLHSIGLGVKVGIYTCILVGVSMSLLLVRQVLGLEIWGPLATSAYFVSLALISSAILTVPPHRPEAGGSGSDRRLLERES
jgi:hypothetical protein